MGLASKVDYSTSLSLVGILIQLRVTFGFLRDFHTSAVLEVQFLVQADAVQASSMSK